MVRPAVVLFLVVLVTAFLPVRGHAQSSDLTLEQLAARSEVIATGRVTDLRSEWNADRTRIFTRVILAVDSCFKGNAPGGVLEILVPGGEVGEVGERYSHVPQFSREEAVVVFARTDSRGAVRVTGGQNGKFSVRHDTRTDRMLVGQGEPLEAFLGRITRAVTSTRQD